MSSTGRGARLGGPDDFYVTPAWTVARLLEKWTPPPGWFLEPCAGNGAVFRALLADGYDPPRADAVECRAVEKAGLLTYFNHVYAEDFLSLNSMDLLRDCVAVIITNPPYHSAEAFIRKARKSFPLATSAWLVRQGFLASEERAPLWKDVGAPDVYILPNRPSFTPDGKTDSADYCWIVLPPVARPFGKLVMLDTTPLEIRRPKTSKKRRAA